VLAAVGCARQRHDVAGPDLDLDGLGRAMFHIGCYISSASTSVSGGDPRLHPQEAEGSGPYMAVVAPSRW
jgi:hypothetical protein